MNNKIFRYLVIGVTILVVAYLVYTFASIVTYVLISWVLSMIGAPFMRFFQKRLRIGKKFRAGPTLSAALTIICFFIIIFFLLRVFVPLIIDQANNLAEVDYAAIAGALEEPFLQFQAWLERLGINTEDTSPEKILENAFKNNFDPSRFGTLFTTIISTAGNVVISVFSIVFITFFFLKEKGLFTEFLTTLSPTDYENQVRKALGEIKELLVRYFGGIIIQISIITFIVSSLLSLLGVQNALLIGLFAGLINVIPYLGPLIGAAVGVFITISSNLDLNFYEQMLPLLLKVVSVFVVMQLVDNFVLQPFIFSTSVRAHPLEIFLVILMGAQIYGIVGMVLAIPAYTIIRVVGKVFFNRLRIVQRMTRKMNK